ncbi:MAG: CAP domain-containing protein [bacterium]|nr:CAP domain-containing protein [bacterium]
MKLGLGNFLRLLLLVSPVVILGVYLSDYSTSESSTGSSSPQVASAVTFAAGSTMPDPNELLRLVNSERQSNKLPALYGDPELAQVASVRAQEIVAERLYSHTNSSGEKYYHKLSSPTGYSCENLALESTMTESAFVSSWLESTNGHKECLLSNQITRAGYAVRFFETVQTNLGSEQYFVVVAIHSR